MRDFKGMKRQRGRNRGGGGNKPQQHNANRAFDSNGPEGVKVRGAAQSVFEKYQQLARDAAQGGDRVLAENHLQHAEHYLRVLRAIQPNRPINDIVGRDQFSSGFDIDFEAEPEEVAEAEAEAPAAEGDGGEDRQREERPRFDRDRQRDDRPRDDRQRDDRPRDDRQRDDRQRDGQPREDRQSRRDRWRDRDDRQRDDRPRDESREDRPREDRPPREGREGRRFDRGDRQDRPERDPLAVVEPQATPLTAPTASEEPAESSPRLRGQDGAVSELPAFLGRSSAPAEEAPAEAAPKPRRRRAPRTGEAKAETEEA